MELNCQEKIDQYTNKYKGEIAKDFVKEKCKINIFSDQNDDLLKAAEQIKLGQLVSFPTETVYGLGANAENPEAVKKIFLTKRRPFTDPVIVHVISVEQGLQYVKIKEDQKELFQELALKLWPGPLTFILPCNFEKLDKVITAQSDFVGIRWPKNTIAQQLIKMSGVAIAAPSANLFSHVSPTSSVHVFNDFFDQQINLIDGDKCEYGIESTVIKLNEKTIEILRYGSISQNQIRQALGEKFKNVEIIKGSKVQNENQNQISPGQLLKHYSPNINCFLFEKKTTKQDYSNLQQTQILLSESVILDFNKQNIEIQNKSLHYKQMTEKDDLREVMQKLYDLLRWAENQPQVQNVLIFDVQSYYQQITLQSPEFLETVFDKIFRSSEGKKLYLDQNNFNFYQ